MTVKQYTMYRHKKSNTIYNTSQIVPIKLNKKWIENGAVIYHSLSDAKTYIRLIDDFAGAFEELDPT